MRRILLLAFVSALSVISTARQDTTVIQHGASLPATCSGSAGEIFFLTSGDVGIYACTATNTWTHAGQSGTSTYVKLQDYGAVCDGTTNDHDAIQTAFDDAVANHLTILFPPKVCASNAGLVFGNLNTDPDYARASIFGQSPATLLYTGSDPDITFVRANHWSYSSIDYLLIQGPFGPLNSTPATATGLLITGTGHTGGTMSTTDRYHGLAFYGWHIGMLAGAGDAASEQSCYDCVFARNDVGWTADGFNTLNFWFYNITLSFNTHGMEIGNGQTTDGPMVIGGDTSGDIVDFYFGSQFGKTTIKQIRAELGTNGYFIDGAPTDLVVEDCTIAGINRSDLAAIRMTGYRTAVIQRNDIRGGKIFMQPTPGGSLVVQDNWLLAEGNSPVKWTAPNGESSGGHVMFARNQDSAGSRPKLPDVYGTLGHSPLTEGTLNWLTNFPESVQGQAEGMTANVRGLGFGSVVQGYNLRDSATFASSDTAAFTFKRTVSVDTTIQSYTIAFSSGDITAYDIGKQISIAAAATSCGYGGAGPSPNAVVATIVSLTNATHAVIVPVPWFGRDCSMAVGASLTGATATIGQDETDAKYRVYGLTCDANETFWVDSSTFATTGFTLKSSNATSSATCAFMVVR